MNCIVMMLFLSLIAVVVVPSKHGRSPYRIKYLKNSRNRSRTPTLEMKTPGRMRQLFAMEALLNEKENSVCSPVSAMMPLGKLALGVGSEAPRELLQLLGLRTQQEIKDEFQNLVWHLERLPGVKMSIASKLYVPRPYKSNANQQFVEDSRYAFKTDIDEINFHYPNQASNQINEFVRKKTMYMIDNVILPSEIPWNSRQSSMLIVNAVSLEVKWQLPFRNHKNLPFYSTKTGRMRLVPMMSNNDEYYYYTESAVLNARLIEVPLEKNHASLIIVMPESHTGLDTLLRKIRHQPDLIDKALKNMTFREVEVSIPKFKTVQTTLNLRNLFETIGLQHIFKIKSGLTNIIMNKELMVETAIQKCSFTLFSEVMTPFKPSILRNESTNEVYQKMVMIDPMLSHKVKFTVDRPFLYYILMKTMNEQIFVGIYRQYT